VRAHRRESFSAFLQNLRASDIPLPRRLAVMARNLTLRVALRRGCCGHDGEPGC
jgi:hypothetical protein